jgi:hypothetical protein
MGQAKRRRDFLDAQPLCRGCDLCCVLPDIAALDKPMYKPCGYLCAAENGAACSVFGQPMRPRTCIEYDCAYVRAHRLNHEDQHRIPHPLDCGAYTHIDPVTNVVVVFVDFKKPELWKQTSLAPYIRAFLAQGCEGLIIDRGRRLVIRNVFVFDQLLKTDFVAFADKEGRPRDIESYESPFI